MSKGRIMQEKGAVTFLDVLGWKGIWERNSDAIARLQDLICKINEKAKEISDEYTRSVTEFRGKDNIIKVLSISDTIAFFTEGSVKNAIEIHAKLCAWTIAYAFEQELPLRGAISYGSYSISDNIMLGYAVDEAASWHESTDWIGVILTPSAQINLRNNKPEYVIEYKNIPFKKKINTLNLCVNWSFEDEDEFIKIINEKGPHIPEIAPKYLNTLEFLEYNKR